MNLRVKLGKGNYAELDAALAESDEALRVHKEKLATLAELARDPSVLERFRLKVGDVLVEIRPGRRRSLVRWVILGTELDGRYVTIVAANILADGSLGKRKFSTYDDVYVEGSQSDVSAHTEQRKFSA